MHPSTHFTHALCRTPPLSAVDGLRAIDTGAPDIARLRADHADYVAALRATGARVEVLDPAEDFPDSLFVEDCALCLPEGAVILTPGAPTRQGEAPLMAPVLERYYGAVATLARGHVEGGDVLVTGREVLVGLSARTDRDGVLALGEIVSAWGYLLRAVETPPEVLHFKTDCSLLAPDVVLATARLAATGCFDGYEVLRLPEGEEPAANAIRFNDVVLLPACFAKTAEMLTRAGYDVVEISNDQAAKLDGGMSCLSLRFTPPRG
ncbi:MAG TPA: dimethylarginine dimethylaminohydrolase [Aliiroseovarius sp.]|nr:dimethylarginine dimethylaminohydrolase [Aliiroseovarius sp.]